jgi:magnesium transporter
VNAQRIAHRQGPKAGLSPGTLVHIGERHMDRPRIRIFEYDDTVLVERELADLKDAPPRCRQHADRDTVVWVNIDGVHEASFVTELGRQFSLHPLLLEDVMNVGQRPKLEEYDDHLFIVVKMLDVDHAESRVLVEQVSMVIGRGFVLTFQERDGDVFDGVRERLRTGKGKIRRMGADYLAYALLDAIADHYFVAVDTMNGLVEDLEHRLQEDATPDDAAEIYTLKREVLFLRRSIGPAREVLGQLVRQEAENEVIGSAVDVYFRDVHDHVLQVNESLEILREMLVSMLEMYHSIQGSRLNEGMRILTVISTFFMPITFIAGVYGMNFDNMPELHAPWGYAACLVVMFVVSVAMLVYMRRKRWI